jgi:hypothetical protein
MTVRVYKSSDASAPVLTGAVGSLVALLDACLVNGYGALSAAGWTKAFTATNKGAYKQNLTGSNNTAGMYLYVDDSGPGAGGAREARVAGFETMSAITPVGTGQFPSSGQTTIGAGGYLVIRKSTTADATARNWTLVANGQTFYLFVESGDYTAPIGTATFCFGDFKAYKTGDQYAVMIIGRQAENSALSSADPLSAVQLPANGGASIQALNTTMYGHYVARHWTGVGGSIKVGKPVDFSRIAGSCGSVLLGNWSAEGQTIASGGFYGLGRHNNSSFQWPAPNGADGALILAPVYLGHNYALRGYLPGMWHPMHDRPLGHNDSITVAGGNLNGKSLLTQSIQFCGATANDTAQVLVETSDTWS